MEHKTGKAGRSANESEESHSLQEVPRFLEDHELNKSRLGLLPDALELSYYKPRHFRPRGSDLSSATSRVQDYGAKARYHKKVKVLYSDLREATDTAMGNLLIGVGGTFDTLKLDGRMKDALEDAMIDCVPDDTKQFLPAGALDRIMTQLNVEKEIKNASKLRSLPPAEIQALVAYVCGPPNGTMDVTMASRKIFALLALLDKVHFLPDFMKEKITDANLPLFKPSTENEIIDAANTLVYRQKAKSTKKDNQAYADIAVRLFSSWEPREIKRFYARQWELLVPFLAKTEDGSVAMYELDQQAIMPWTHYDEKNIRRGGFATVRQVKIHADHHAFPTDKNDCFALKTVVDAEQDEFEQEFYVFRKLKTKNNHLLPLHAAFRRGHEYAFLFPWANGGNLVDLWTTDPTSHCNSNHRQASRNFTLWLAQQCLGIVRGLRGIHDVRTSAKEKNLALDPNKIDPSEARQIADDFGIHGDIKPENILVFNQSGNEFGGAVLKISDFGLTNFYTKYSRSRQLETDGPADIVYRAPESDLTVRYMSRKYDIWSLGCVFSQLLTWVIRGPEALDEYETLRLDESDQGKNPHPSFSISKYFKKIYPQDDANTEPQIVVKESVVKWLESLKNDAGNSNFLTDFVNFIKDRMLVVDVTKRSDCAELLGFLSKKYEKCRSDEQYSSPDLAIFQRERRRPIETNIAVQVTDPEGNQIPPATVAQGAFRE